MNGVCSVVSRQRQALHRQRSNRRERIGERVDPGGREKERESGGGRGTQHGTEEDGEGQRKGQIERDAEVFTIIHVAGKRDKNT
jgi:hypothetical protein